MEAQNIVDVDEEATVTLPLLKCVSPHNKSNVDAETEKSNRPADALTAVVIFSTLISVLGSYVFGTAVSTNPAQCNLSNS